MRAFIKGIGSLAVLAALLFGAVEGVAFLARYVGRQVFHGVNPTVAAAAVTAMATVLVTVATLVIGRYLERRKSVEAEIRASKIPVYTRLVSGLMRTVMNPDSSNADEVAQFLREITPDLITWASDDVLLAWSKFKREAQVLAAEDTIFSFEELLSAIRRDFGHSGRQVKEGDLLALFINDIDEQLTRRRAQRGAV
ncbi:hypothetical protein JK359_13980 [Streptomyces actinomycinicus]|uniref:DUF4760 domain-containing protein n=1 Tax=Streptomyces actinomycinicus TaxID=1695166 RepID=A0A937JL03_9ACTN|nr:hypothetical protein [Streptomyces actinomycinicus]MBL1083079.1 hypothetical protein [Streptomyces actinomycinicus]